MSPDDAERELAKVLKEASREENRERLDVLLNRIRILLAERKEQKKKSPNPPWKSRPRTKISPTLLGSPRLLQADCSADGDDRG